MTGVLSLRKKKSLRAIHAKRFWFEMFQLVLI